MKFDYFVTKTDDRRKDTVLSSLNEVSDYTGLCMESVRKCIDGGTIKGWKVDRKKVMTAKEMLKKPYTIGVVVYLHTGKTISFDSITKCSERLGVSRYMIARNIEEGMPDNEGNYYDESLEYTIQDEAAC